MLGATYVHYAAAPSFLDLGRAPTSLSMDAPCSLLVAPLAAPATAFFGKSAGVVSRHGEPSPHADLEHKPVSLISASCRALSVDFPAASGKSQNPVRAASPEHVEGSCPHNEHRGYAPCPRGGHRAAAAVPSCLLGTHARGLRCVVSEPSPYVSVAFPRGGYGGGRAASHQYHENPQITRQQRNEVITTVRTLRVSFFRANSPFCQ